MESIQGAGTATCVLNLGFEVIEANSACKLAMEDDALINHVLLIDEHAIMVLERNGKFDGNATFSNSKGTVFYARCRIIRKGDKYVVFSLRSQNKIDSKIREKVFLDSPMPSLIISSEHVIVDVNSALLKLLKAKREDIVGKLCYPIMHGTSAPPDGCPLVEVKSRNLEEGGMNLMHTVLGDYLIVVRKLAPGLYGHYAIKEAAVLLEAQDRMMAMLKRYNRILLDSLLINTIFIAGDDISKSLEKVADRLMEVDEFAGVLIFAGVESGKSTINISRGKVELPNRRFVDMDWHGKITVSVNSMRNVIIPIQYESVSGYIVINTGNEELSDDELKVLQTLANNIGMYIESKNLDMKREIAYKYMIELMNDFAQLVDKIRNPLAVIMATAEVELEDDDIREKIIENVEKVQDITRKIDELWNRAEKMQESLKKKE